MVRSQKIDNSVAALHRFDTRYQIAKVVIDAIKWVLIAYFTYSSIDAIAGKMTITDITVDAAFNSKECNSYTVYYVFAILVSILVAWFGIFYGRRESKLRKDTVEKMAFEIKTLQKIIDSGRTSSLLTSRGETSARDRR